MRCRWRDGRRSSGVGNRPRKNTGNRAGLTRLMQGRCGGKVLREKQERRREKHNNKNHKNTINPVWTKTVCLFCLTDGPKSSPRCSIYYHMTKKSSKSPYEDARQQAKTPRSHCSQSKDSPACNPCKTTNHCFYRT